MGLAGDRRVALEAVYRGARDLGVPVRALDQAHRDEAAVATGEVGDPVDHERRALEVRLDDDAQAVPAVQRRVRPRGFELVQRQFQAVGVLGVAGHADAVLLRALGETTYPRGQFGQARVPLAGHVTRVRRRGLHR